MSTQYRRNPVNVEAVQYDGDNKHEVVTFMDVKTWFTDSDKPTTLCFATDDGGLTIELGDFVVRDGTEDGVRVYKPDVFAKKYGPAEPETTAWVLASFRTELLERGVPADLAHELVTQALRCDMTGRALKVRVSAPAQTEVTV